MNKSTELLIEQLAHETRNCNIYLSFSALYCSEGLMQLSHYFQLRANEELNHRDWIINFLRSRCVAFNFPAVLEAKDASIDKAKQLLIGLKAKSCPLTLPFAQTVVIERETTDLIKKIYDQACTEKDYKLISWLQQRGEEEDSDTSITDTDNGQLLLEQEEEEHISMAALQIAIKDIDWLTKEQSIINYYKER